MSPAAHDDGPWAWVFTPRGPNEKRYWLVKSEPDVFSFDDLQAAPKQTTLITRSSPVACSRPRELISQIRSGGTSATRTTRAPFWHTSAP